MPDFGGMNTLMGAYRRIVGHNFRAPKTMRAYLGVERTKWHIARPKLRGILALAASPIVGTESVKCARAVSGAGDSGGRVRYSPRYPHLPFRRQAQEDVTCDPYLAGR